MGKIFINFQILKQITRMSSLWFAKEFSDILYNVYRILG